MHRRTFIGLAAATAAGGAMAGATPVFVRRLARRTASSFDVATFHASRKFASTSFGRIAYVERGSGPVALFIHGLPLNGYQWRGALERLSSIRRCIAPDSMGLGYSEVHPGQDLSPEAQVAMLVAFLDVLGIDRVDLVGSDSGGAVAQIFVAHHPERVRTLLLTNCDVHDDSPPPALVPVIEASRAGTFADDVLVPQVRDHSRVRLTTGLGGCCYTHPADLTRETLLCYLEPLVATPQRKQQLHAYCIALARNPLLAIAPALRRSEVPLRVIWGTGDTIFSPKSPDWLDETFPRSRGVRRIEGANLFFPEEMPDVIAEEATGLWG